MPIRIKQGFTLVELMVVVAVIAILAAIVYPSYQDSVRKTKRAEGRAALMALMQQEERFYSQSNGYIAFSSESTDANAKKFKWYSGDSASSSAYEIKAEPCTGQKIQECVMLTAQPGTSKVDAGFKDTVCGDLIFTSVGDKLPANKNCW